jgi:hypothetical protein
VANKQYIERLTLAIERLHKCRATWFKSVAVHQVFHGKTAWKGFVEVFGLSGHPKARWVYGWSHPEGEQGQDECFVTVLETPPVDSPETAVKVAIVAETKKKNEAQ